MNDKNNGPALPASLSMASGPFADRLAREAQRVYDEEIASYACAECGTRTATTYVVTQLGPADDSTRTEVCRACDDELRIRPVLDAFRQHAQDISPDRDPHNDDIESPEDSEADTWVAAAEEARIALGLPDAALLHVVGHVDNIYEDGDEVRVEFDVQVPFPTEGDLDEWAEDNLFPLTGTGRTDGDAGYFLEITQCEERPDLVGRKFEWGI